MKTLFAQLDEIYKELDTYIYDELTEYEQGLKDILNLLDTRMSGNNVDDMFEGIMNTIKNNHSLNYEYYYQIDYIDEEGLANYIKTFDKDERNKAIEVANELNQANMCINGTTTRYVLDYYRYQVDNNGHAIDDSDELLENIKIDGDK